MFSCQKVDQATPDYPSSQDEDDETSSPHVVLPGPGLISYLDDVLFRTEKPLDLDVDEVGDKSCLLARPTTKGILGLLGCAS